MESVPEITRKSVEKNRNILQKRSYEIEGIKINVSWKEFFPTNKEAPRDEAIIFFPGYSAGTAKTLEYLSQRFAEDSGKTTLFTSTGPEKFISNSLYKEATAVRNLIIEKGLKKITVVARSEGGIRAADLIDVMQKENPEIDISGLVLINPIGLHEQDGNKLAMQFLRETFDKAPKGYLREKNLPVKDRQLFKKLVRIGQAGSDIFSGILKDIYQTKGIGFPAKLKSQIAELSRKNPCYQSIKCLIILIQGKNDLIAPLNEVIPNVKKPEDLPDSLTEREKILKDIFPVSPRVIMLVPEKVSNHGVAHFRPDSVSKTVFHFLKRYQKSKFQ